VTPTARLVAAARAVCGMTIGPLTAEQAEKLLQLDLALRLLDAIPSTAEPTDDELWDVYLWDVYFRALRSAGWKDRTYDESEALGRRALYRLGVERERARIAAFLDAYDACGEPLKKTAQRIRDGWHWLPDALEDDHG